MFARDDITHAGIATARSAGERPGPSGSWSFFATKMLPDGRLIHRDLIKAGWTHIVRHVKIQGEANPYDPAWKQYFSVRKSKKLYYGKDSTFVGETGWLNDEKLP